MSIIHDALKKAEKNLTSLAQVELECGPVKVPVRSRKENQVRQRTAGPEGKGPRALNKLRLLMLMVLLILLFSLVCMMFSTPQSKASATDTALAATTPVLEGVMMMHDHAYAVIDGRMYGVGEVVSGEKITKIKSDEIVVLRNGQLKTLNVNSHL